MDKETILWIDSILEANDKLVKAERIINRRLEKLMGDIVTPTAKLFDAVIKLNDLKVALVNLRVLFMLMESECAEDFTTIREYAKNHAVKTDGCKNTFYRKLRILYARCRQVLIKSGFDKARLSCDFGRAMTVLGKM